MDHAPGPSIRTRLRVLLGLTEDEAQRVMTERSMPKGIETLTDRTSLPPAEVRRLIETPELAAEMRVNPNEATSAQLHAVPGITPRGIARAQAGRPYFAIEEFGAETGLEAADLAALFAVPSVERLDKTTGRREQFRPVPFTYVIPPPAEFETAEFLSALGFTEVQPADPAAVRVVTPSDFEDLETAPLKSAYAGRVVPVVEDEAGKRRYFVPGQLDVWIDPGTPRDEAEALLARHGLTIVNADSGAGFYQCRISQTPPGTDVLRAVLDAIDAVSAEPAVLFAEPVETGIDDFETSHFRMELVEFEDASGQRDWNHAAIHSTQAHEVTTGSPDVVIFVIDSGIRLTHPDLQAALDPVWDTLDLDYSVEVDPAVTSPAETGIPHGTSVAGVAAGRASDALAGARGVAPGVWLLPIKISGTPLSGSYGLRALAIRKAVEYLPAGRRGVINLSWSTSGEHIGIREALIHATGNGLAVVASAGNYKPGEPQTAGELHYPSSYAAVPGTTSADIAERRRIPGVCSVAAVNAANRRASYSYYGATTVSFAAPGGEPGSAGSAIFVASSPGGYAYVAGTSFAAPHVTGLIGLLFSLRPTLTPQEAIDTIASTCVDLTPLHPDMPGALGAGLVDALAAVQTVAGDKPSPLPGETPGGTTPEPGDDDGSAGTGSGAQSSVDINTATVDQLAGVPFLGHWTAARIVADRETRGPFSSVDDLLRTGVIDAWTLAQIRPYIVALPVDDTESADTAPSPGVAAVSGASGRMSLNHASVAEIASLPLLGPWTAARIVAHRERLGHFDSADDMLRLGLLDDWTLAQIRSLIEPA